VGPRGRAARGKHTTGPGYRGEGTCVWSWAHGSPASSTRSALMRTCRCAVRPNRV